MSTRDDDRVGYVKCIFVTRTASSDNAVDGIDESLLSR